MTDCLRTDIRDVLPDWVHDSLGEREAAEIAEHVATCAACAAEAELLRAVRAVLPPEPPIDVQRIAAGVIARTAGRQMPSRLASWRVVGGGLALAASVAFGLLFLRGDAGEGTNRGSVVSVQSTDSSGRPNATPGTPDDSTSPNDSGGAGQADVPGTTTSVVPEPELRVATAEVAVSGGLADLRIDELETLLRRLDGIEALPQTSPAPLFTPDLEVR